MDTSTSRRWWQPLQSSDRNALVFMIVVPIIVFVVPALFGHPAIDADNLIQNFPLRVLSGRQIASGHLPLLNPYANSGSPLLGGMNAGSLYPLTVIFAFVPPIAAWVVNLIAIYVTAAVGMYALLRWHGLRTVASCAAAMTFTYTGAMIGQIVHLGVIQGYSFIPWTILIVVSLSRRLGELDPLASWRSYARAARTSTLGFAALWGLTFLTGEPRAIAVIELLCLVSIPVVLILQTSFSLRSLRARVTYLTALVLGLAWGVALSLVQLLPGWSFIGMSQRSAISYWYYGAGSLAVRWTPLMLIQDMFGGNSVLGQPHYFVPYNLPEVTGYAGLLALVASAAFLTRLTRRGWVGRERDYVLYVVVGVVGMFATWGSFTPLGHIFHAIPLLGHTRLQSRNIILVDFAASVLLAWWIDRIQARDKVSAGLGARARFITLSPAFAVIALCIAMFAWGSSLVHFLGASSTAASLANGETLSLSLHLAVAVAVVLLLIGWSQSARLVRWLMVVLTVDIIVFLLLCSTGLVGGNGPTMPSRARAVALMGDQGRFAFIDPSGVHHYEFEGLGQPNMNVFTGLASVQGYGSLISTIYDNVTGTHPMASLNRCRLADGTFTQLRLATIVASSKALSIQPGVVVAPGQACRAPAPSSTTHRYFGQSLSVRAISLTGGDAGRVASGPVTLQLLTAAGRPLGAPMVRPGARMTVFEIPAGTKSAYGFIASAPGGISLSDATVIQRGAHSPRYQLDTPLQMALSTSSWRLTSTVDSFAVIKATHVEAPEWLQAPSATSRITMRKNASWGDSWVGVTTARPVVLERSMAYLPGWRATALKVATGQQISLPVTRMGQIQEVTVPAGRWTVHFHYHAPYIELGVLVSTLSSVALFAGVLVVVVGRRRGPNDKVRL